MDGARPGDLGRCKANALLLRSQAMPKTRKCFVVGPIGAEDSTSRVHADWLLDGVILPIFAEHFKDFDVKRSDRISEPGMIDSQMIARLLDDDLVIADLSELNANAFYEIGIRHMTQKPIIHMFLVGTKIPFDVGPYRAIAFNTVRHRDLEIAKASLKTAVEDVLLPTYEVDNPVTRARGALKLRENATPEARILLDKIEALESAVMRLNRESKATVSVPAVRDGGVISKTIGPVMDWTPTKFELQISNKEEFLRLFAESFKDYTGEVSHYNEGKKHVIFFMKPLSPKEITRTMKKMAEFGATNIVVT